jgi:hypothetical protein
MSEADLEVVRSDMGRRGLPVDGLGHDELRSLVKMIGEGFRDNAPTTAAQAATIILDGVRADRWRILVGDDAHNLDQAVRADPEGAYGDRPPGLGSIIGMIQPS